MPSATEQAAKRLDAAFQSLEFAVQQRLLLDGGVEDRAEEIHMLIVDRARLAEDVDQSQARAARLENANRSVSGRLAAAIGVIRAVLGAEAERG